MKPCVTLLAFAALLSACTKQDILQQQDMTNDAGSKNSSTVSQNGAYATAWEQYNDWTKKDENGFSIYSFSRKASELTPSVVEGGLVITYAKVATTDANYQQFTNPGAMPFYFLPPGERPNPGAFYFSDNAAPGMMTVSYAVPSGKSNTPAMGGGVSLNDF